MKFFISIILFFNINIALYGWTKLKPLKNYQPNEFNLKEGIEYFEIRQYDSNKRLGINRRKYRVRYPIYKKPLSKYSYRLKKQFKHILPNLSKETDIKKLTICITGGCKTTIGNGFYIDVNGNMGYMNEVTDVISFLGKIDTPAELQFVLWMNNKEDGKYYKKVRGGYEVIIDYVNSVANFGKCGKFRDRAIIGYNGKLLSYKTLKYDPTYIPCIKY